MSMPSIKQMERAVATRDASFNGDFYYGVITTGVFCLPSCSTKAANPENIRFFPTAESAMQSGYRPCKRCCPVGNEKRLDRLIQVARHIEKNVEDKLTLEKLSEIAELSPSRLQRVFKETFGISPKQYRDAVQMRQFKNALQEGKSVTDAVFDSGFSSISRVYGEATRHIGMTPKTYRKGGEGEVIHYACKNTALGMMIMAATEKGVCSVQFGDNEETLLSYMKNEFPSAEFNLSTSQDSLELDHWMTALDKHIDGNAPKPELPLDIQGTAFQMKVWQFLLSIKEGDVMSYGEVAEGIGNAKAVRAVGTACGKNPVGVLIPCHRVLRGDGSLGGYRWGLERKRALLDKESRSR